MEKYPKMVPKIHTQICTFVTCRNWKVSFIKPRVPGLVGKNAPKNGVFRKNHRGPGLGQRCPPRICQIQKKSFSETPIFGKYGKNGLFWLFLLILQKNHKKSTILEQKNTMKKEAKKWSKKGPKSGPKKR